MRYSDIKKCTLPDLKKPLAFTSSQALSSMFADRNAKFSPVTGCRAGFVATSLHTCDSKAASRSRISSWRECTKPPFLQSRACTVLKSKPQGHVLGKPDIDLLYRSANASQNSCLFNTYPSSSKGRTFSQLDVPLFRIWDIVLNFS